MNDIFCKCGCLVASTLHHILLLSNSVLKAIHVLMQKPPFYILRLLTQDGIIETVKRKRYFEKPYRERQRRSFENCRRIYNAEMARKIAFVSKTNRKDPWLGY